MAQKFRLRTAQDDLLAATVKFFHPQKQGADAIAIAVVFAWQHFLTRQQGVQFRRQFDDNALTLNALDRTDHDIGVVCQESSQNLLTLGIADALQDDLFGSLRGLATKTFVGQLFFVVIAHGNVDAGNFFLNLLDGFFQFGIGIGFVFHNQPPAESLVAAGIAVDLHAHVHMLALGLFLGGDAQSKFQSTEYDFGINVLLTGQGFGQLQNLAAHVVSCLSAMRLKFKFRLDSGAVDIGKFDGNGLAVERQGQYIVVKTLDAADKVFLPVHRQAGFQLDQAA